MSQLDTALAKLKELGVQELEHIDCDLEKHLKGTYDLLKSWGNEEYVCLAGLYHSVYGTASFKTQAASLEKRKEIAAIIGEQAEKLVYFFAACDRAYTYAQLKQHADKPLYKDRFTGEIFPLSAAMLTDFSEVTFANELEILRRIKSKPKNISIFHFRDLLQSLSQYVSADAQAKFTEVFSHPFFIPSEPTLMELLREKARPVKRLIKKLLVIS